MRLELGRRVRSKDDVIVGELADVIIDPVKQRLTHLVVKPRHGHGESRLVSIDAAVPDDTADEIVLRCSEAELHGLPNVEEFAFLRLGEAPVADPDWDVGVTNVLAYPYYESGGLVEYGAFVQDVGAVYDRIPKGEVEIRRTSSVLSADGNYVGDVDGFLVDDEERITHFVLERGHLWGRREVTVPIGAVTKVESDSVSVGLSIDEIGALPAHKVHRWLVFGHA
jgi:sporulation protein YlmC with PRC-barrel domain